PPAARRADTRPGTGRSWERRTIAVCVAAWRIPHFGALVPTHGARVAVRWLSSSTSVKCVAGHGKEADGSGGMITGQAVAAYDERSTSGGRTKPNGHRGAVGTSVRALRPGANAASRSSPTRADGPAATRRPW